MGGSARAGWGRRFPIRDAQARDALELAGAGLVLLARRQRGESSKPDAEQAVAADFVEGGGRHAPTSVRALHNLAGRREPAQGIQPRIPRQHLRTMEALFDRSADLACWHA